MAPFSFNRSRKGAVWVPNYLDFIRSCAVACALWVFVWALVVLLAGIVLEHFGSSFVADWAQVALLLVPVLAGASFVKSLQNDFETHLRSSLKFLLPRATWPPLHGRKLWRAHWNLSRSSAAVHEVIDALAADDRGLLVDRELSEVITMAELLLVAPAAAAHSGRRQ